jgi:protein-S-isoprenylcysteine O-methyltransferase Ste14
MDNPPQGSSHASSFHLPPPLVYAVPFVGALLLDRWHPLPLLPRTIGTWIGLPLFALATIGISALLRFRRARTSPLPWRPTTALVTDGPYRISRNPMYLGLTLLYLGATALANSAWPLVGLPVIILVMNVVVIPGEEARLEAMFGPPIASTAPGCVAWTRAACGESSAARRWFQDAVAAQGAGGGCACGAGLETRLARHAVAGDPHRVDARTLEMSARVGVGDDESPTSALQRPQVTLDLHAARRTEVAAVRTCRGVSPA